jgi:uncharacterized protein YdhG (YjbR/CyaY superfamily)
MATKMIKATTVDEYINNFPAEIQSLLQKVRKTIKTSAPKAEEVISYGIPGYKYYGMLIFFSAWKEHISIYPAPRTHEAFKKELSAYKGGKGTAQFPFDTPIPYDLIKRITQFRVKSNEEAFTAKAGKSAKGRKTITKKSVTKKVKKK